MTTLSSKQLPCPVYSIGPDGIGRTALLVAVRGSWWHVRHADGSLSKLNGGQSIPGGARYFLTLRDAWAEKIFNAIRWIDHFRPDMQPSREQAAYDLIHACQTEMIKVGRMCELLRIPEELPGSTPENPEK